MLLKVALSLICQIFRALARPLDDQAGPEGTGRVWRILVFPFLDADFQEWAGEEVKGKSW